jgi:hypothetical protein
VHRRLAAALLALVASVASAFAALRLIAPAAAHAAMFVAPSLPCSQDDRGQIWPQHARVGVRK